MNNFLHFAQAVLHAVNQPLHYKEITNQAIENGLQTDGKTPWATMNAKLSIDIKNEKSPFVRTEPGIYSLKEKITTTKTVSAKARIVRHKITENLNSKQKGDIGEARVAELITLYGKEGLTCYKPISDDEGIDLIVKRRNNNQVSFIQIKSTYGYKERGYVSTVKEKNIPDKNNMLLVFIYFDLSEGDLFDQVFCIPAPDFLRLTNNDHKKPGHRVFTVGLKNPDKSKYAEHMIEKRELANRIIEIMDKL